MTEGQALATMITMAKVIGDEFYIVRLAIGPMTTEEVRLCLREVRDWGEIKSHMPAGDFWCWKSGQTQLNLQSVPESTRTSLGTVYPRHRINVMRPA